MFQITEKSITWGSKKLSLQTGKIARQAHGSVVATYGDTSVLATVVYSKEPQTNLDFFPLTVTYLDKYYAAGKIPGGFFKREGKPTEREILISRLIDRPIRPLFDERMRHEVQIVISILNYDEESTTDILSIVAASAALQISGIKTAEVVGAAKVGFVAGEYILNPGKTEMALSTLELIVAGTKKGVLMVESEAKELTEEQMLGAVKFAQQSFVPVIDFIEDFSSNFKHKELSVDLSESEQMKLFYTKIESLAKDKLTDAYSTTDKTSRHSKISATETFVKESLSSESEELSSLVAKHFNYYFKKLEKDIVRTNILNTGNRIDGRNLEQIRSISTEIDLFSKTHGSALFTRGETQALVFATLGTDSDEQILDDVEGNTRERFMLHYNFPPYSVGEVGRVGAPGRREIGHGKLAWRAINPLFPTKNQFPYTVRIVSEITESNGSSSMATVCGTSLALMSAGVPLAKPIAGIAMGLIKEGDKFAVLSDILGDEDHLGDMDFKVAGTSDGITALQMDIKITSITYDIMEKALQQAKAGRSHILKEMSKTISVSKTSLNKYAPKVKVIVIDKEKIKDIIGSGGKIIKEMSELNEVKIDITKEGVVSIYGTKIEGIENAFKTIQGIVAVPEVGKVYLGTVVKVVEFGAFINFLGNRDGLLHVSELGVARDANINDVIKAGDTFNVKVVNIDDKGKVKLTKKDI